MSPILNDELGLCFEQMSEVRKFPNPIPQAHRCPGCLADVTPETSPRCPCKVLQFTMGEFNTFADIRTLETMLLTMDVYGFAWSLWRCGMPEVSKSRYNRSRGGGSSTQRITSREGSFYDICVRVTIARSDTSILTDHRAEIPEGFVITTYPREHRDALLALGEQLESKPETRLGRKRFVDLHPTTDKKIQWRTWNSDENRADIARLLDVNYDSHMLLTRDGIRCFDLKPPNDNEELRCSCHFQHVLEAMCGPGSIILVWGFEESKYTRARLPRDAVIFDVSQLMAIRYLIAYMTNVGIPLHPTDLGHLRVALDQSISYRTPAAEDVYECLGGNLRPRNHLPYRRTCATRATILPAMFFLALRFHRKNLLLFDQYCGVRINRFEAGALCREHYNARITDSTIHAGVGTSTLWHQAICNPGHREHKSKRARDLATSRASEGGSTSGEPNPDQRSSRGRGGPRRSRPGSRRY